ncbi:hypothetical protein ACOBQB_18465 [Streptomyces sp. G5(2025)]
MRAGRSGAAGPVLGCVGRPEGIAEAGTDLVNSSYITGEALPVDGGGHLR